VTHLRFRARSGCTEGLTRAIEVQDTLNVDIRANRIVNPPDSLGTACGFDNGIDVYASTGRIRYNLVQDWKNFGIYVGAALPEGGRVLETENSLRFRHTGVLGLGAGFRGGIVTIADGTNWRTIINRNVVTIAKTGGLGPTDSPTVRSGIGWEAQRVTVRDNRVTNAEYAITSFGGQNVIVTGNRARGIAYDCYSEGPTEGWSDNNGRAWKSDPVGLCSVPK
jgi:hypothetical protein